MIKGTLQHTKINISNPAISIPFYKEFFTYLQYKIIEESDEHIAFTDGVSDFWLIKTESGYENTKFNSENTGLNHFAFIVESKDDVDTFYKDFILNKNRTTLYGAPALYPEYHKDYYAVFFEDPDGIKLEIMYRSF